MLPWEPWFWSLSIDETDLRRKSWEAEGEPSPAGISSGFAGASTGVGNPGDTSTTVRASSLTSAKAAVASLPSTAGAGAGASAGASVRPAMPSPSAGTSAGAAPSSAGSVGALLAPGLTASSSRGFSAPAPNRAPDTTTAAGSPAPNLCVPVT